MKKTKIFSILGAAALAVTSLGLNVFAAEGDPVVQTKTDTHSVTIEKKDSEAHTYEAYQLFKGVLTGEDESAVMTYIEWGSNVDTSKLAAEIAKNSKVNTAVTAYNAANDPDLNVTDAADFAAFISNSSSDADFAPALADLFNAVLTGTPAKDLTIAAGEDTTTGTMTGLTTGYYLIKDKSNSLKDKNGAYTDFILKLVNDVTVASKSDVPSIDKNIVVDNTLKKADTASIGDKISYQLDTKVPNMEGYNKYYFIVNDKMCKGLAFQNDVQIKIEGDEAPLAADAYSVTSEENAAEETLIKIVFKNFIQYKTQAGKKITITYSAILDDDCDRTVNGNPNVVGLTFSNDPNHKYNGSPDDVDQPDDDEPMGNTPQSKTKVYTTGVRIIKVDNNGNKVTGAKFRLYGGKLNKVIVVKGSKFVEAADGTYYLLKNGTYTDEAPTELTADQYDAEGKRYKLVEYSETTVEKSTLEDADSAHNGDSYVEAEVDAEGYLVFSGLNAGTYTLVESEAPAGYNIDPNEYTIVIANDEGKPTFETPGWNVTMDGTDKSVRDEEINNANGFTVATKQITNRKGIILPATGGIGTVLFYTIGSLLIGGAAVLFVTKKKKQTK